MEDKQGLTLEEIVKIINDMDEITVSDPIIHDLIINSDYKARFVGEYVELKSGKRLPKWYSDALTKAKTPEERSILRSKTFPGIAKAMAEQWTNEDRLNNLGDDDCEL